MRVGPRALSTTLVLSLSIASQASPVFTDTDDRPPTTQEMHKYQLDPVGFTENRVGGQYGDNLSNTTCSSHHRDPRGWVNPNANGGSMLDLVNNGLREPINAIISGHSDPYILTDRGLRDYVRSIGFSFECLDLHMGDLQRANLGDGAGWKEEMFEYRSTQGFGAPGRWVGACWESWNGGDHFRAWKQNGSEADTGAWFLAVSNEKNLRHRHTIAPNGYDEGRDMLVAAAMQGGQFADRLWKADVEWVEGLLPTGSDGINHGISIDGITAVLTVQRHYTVTLPGTSPHFALTLGRLLQRVEEMQEYVESATGHIASLSLRGLRKVVQWAGGSRAAE